MAQQVGTVTAVQSERRGVIATSWTGTQMSVVNAADLDREGGTLSPDGGQTTYAYTAVTDGATDDAPDTVTMADAAPAEWPTAFTDPETGDVIPAEVRLDVWPERLDVTAMVDLGDGETIPAVVPHSLRPLLVDGVREPGMGETVQLARVAGVWTVSDVPGKRAVVEGTKVAVPDTHSLPRAEMDDASFTVYKDDGEGGAVATTILGGDRDQLQIFGTDGVLRGGIDQDGVVVGSSVQTPQVLLDGDDVRGLIDAMSWGYTAGHIFTADAGPIGQTEKIICDVQFTAIPGRKYKITFNASCDIPAGSRFIPYFRISAGEDGASTAPQPTVSSQSLGNGIFPPLAYADPTNPAAPVMYSMPWTPDSLGITQPTAVRIGLSALLQYKGVSTLHKNTGYFEITDMGSRYKGVFADGNFGSGAVTTVTQYFQPEWTTVWRNGTSQPGVVTPQQGYATRALGVGHPGGMWYTMVKFPDAMRAFMAGAQKISDVSLWTNSYDCMNASGFVPRLSWHAQSTSPTGPVGSGDFDLRNLPKGAVRWNQLPSGAWSNIQSGAYLGLTFGLRTGQDAKYAGCFSITDGAPGAFRVTVTK
jgi:uncharacterized RmlC-like cupin family protein